MLDLVSKRFRANVRDEKAQPLTEYALILVLIAIVVIATVSGLGEKIAEVFTRITSGISPS